MSVFVVKEDRLSLTCDNCFEETQFPISLLNILRCVPDNKRAFATGMQYLFMKTLGLLPGPLLFGHFVDNSCKLWQNTCGEKGRCFVYDVDEMSNTLLTFGLTTASK